MIFVEIERQKSVLTQNKTPSVRRKNQRAAGRTVRPNDIAGSGEHSQRFGQMLHPITKAVFFRRRLIVIGLDNDAIPRGRDNCVRITRHASPQFLAFAIQQTYPANPWSMWRLSPGYKCPEVPCSP